MNTLFVILIFLALSVSIITIFLEHIKKTKNKYDIITSCCFLVILLSIIILMLIFTLEHL